MGPARTICCEWVPVSHFDFHDDRRGRRGAGARTTPEEIAERIVSLVDAGEPESCKAAPEIADIHSSGGSLGHRIKRTRLSSATTRRYAASAYSSSARRL